MKNKEDFKIYESMKKAPNLMQECLEKPYKSIIENLAEILLKKEIKNYYFVGTGSSYLASISEAYFAMETLGVEAQYVNALDFRNFYLKKKISNGVLFINSHSGKSPGDVVLVKEAKEQGLYTVAVTDVNDTPLTNIVDYVLLGPGGKKFELPSTRTFSLAMYRTFLVLSYIGKKQNKQNKLDELESLPKKVKETMDYYDINGMKFAQTMALNSSYVVLCQGPNFSVAQEGAMGLSQSTSYPSEGILLEEYIHGQIQGVSENCGFIIIAPDGECQKRLVSFAKISETIGGKTFVIIPEDKIEMVPKEILRSNILPMPTKVSEIVSPVLNCVPFWMIGYYLSLIFEKDADLLSMGEEDFKKSGLAEYKLEFV